MRPIIGAETPGIIDGSTLALPSFMSSRDDTACRVLSRSMGDTHVAQHW
jgi:hypothetical protein